MSITQFTRYTSSKGDQLTKAAKEAKAIVEKHGAESFRLSKFYTGPWTGQWTVMIRYSDWETYGKVQAALAKDAAFAKLLAHVATISELMSRNLTIDVDL
jgi:hypothetical protein